MINVALIGYGYWGKILAQSLDKHPAIKLCAIHARTPQNDSRYCSRLSDIWNNKDINAIIIATPLAGRYDITKTALEMGKHVLVEKPLASHPGQTKKLIKLAEQTKRVLMVDYVHSYAPALTKIKEVLTNHSLLQLEMYFWQNALPPKVEGVETLLLSHLLFMSSLLVGESDDWITVNKKITANHLMSKLECHSNKTQTKLYVDLMASEQKRFIVARCKKIKILADFGQDGILKIINNDNDVIEEIQYDNANLLFNVLNDFTNHIYLQKTAQHHLKQCLYIDTILEKMKL